MNYILAYWEAIERGEVVTSRRVRTVYKRLAREIREPDPNSPYYFDEETGERPIIFAEGGGVLLLNKDDLIAFGDIRGTNEKKAVYEIEFSEDSTTTGTIKDGGLAVKFCIVDELPAISKTTTAAGSYCMAYGKPLSYQLDLFGPYTVEVSRDYKFAEGLLAVMGEAMIGGNVITENGFLRIKKKAAASSGGGSGS